MRERGVGPAQLAGPSSVAYDPVEKRLFVSDMGNHRAVVFDVHPDRLTNHPSAIAVMGQADALSRKPRASLDDLKPEALAYDWVHHRLFIAEDLQHRVMVYDAHPDRVGGPTKALAVIGQPDAFSTHPAVGPDRVAMPRLAVEPETQKLYISEGFPAGNRISIFDITPGKLHTGARREELRGELQEAHERIAVLEATPAQRGFSDETRAAIVEGLSTFVGPTAFVLANASDLETTEYAREIASILKDAGWDVPSSFGMTYAPLMLPGYEDSPTGVIFGIASEVPDAFAASVFNVFREGGVDIVRGPHWPGTDHPISILVGAPRQN